MIFLKGSRQIAVVSLAVLVVLSTSLSWALADSSPPLEEWSRTFGGSVGDGGYSVQQTSDGGYIIAGYTNSFGAGGADVYLVKTNSTGWMEWNTTFGSSWSDIGFSVQETSDGGYIIAGETSSFGAGGGDVYLVKADSTGREEWSTAFGGSSQEWGYSVQQTSDGGYIITGYTKSFGAGGADVYLVKADSTGNLMWNTTFGGSNGDYGRSVKETSDGGYIITGMTQSFGAGGADVYLVKTNSTGWMEWNTTLGGADYDWGHSVQQTSDGGYIITGYTELLWPFWTDVYLVKTDSTGSMEWNTTIGASEGAHDEGNSVQQTSDGGYIITGWTVPYEADFADVYLVKTDSTGNLMWNTTFGDSGNDDGWSVQETSDGGYIITGQTYSFDAGVDDVYLVKVGSQGLADETYTPSIVNLEAPSEVYYTETSFTVEFTFSYKFTVPTEIRPRIKDVATGTWIAEEYETLVGEGTQTYRFELTAPEEETTWSLEASVWYYSDGEWTIEEGGRVETFDIQVKAERDEETYSASVVDFEAPSEVYVGEVFTVEAAVVYESTVPTETRIRIYDVAAGAWMTEEFETLVGAGSKTYSFELTAPDQRMTWELEAVVLYKVDGIWLFGDESSILFSVKVVSGDQNWWDWILELPLEYLAIIGLGVLVLLILLLKWIF